MRGIYPEITDKGAEVIVVGTGDQKYANAFIADEHIPFPVLVDDSAEAARAASIKKVNYFTLLFDPRSFKGARRAHRDGYRVHKSGKRVNQLGATFVLGPGAKVRYEHIDVHTADHAPLDDVVAALA